MKRSLFMVLAALFLVACQVPLGGPGTSATGIAEERALGANLALNKPATASAVHSSPYTAAMAVDGNGGTRWASPDGTTACWLQVDFGTPTTFNQSVVKELQNRVTAYTIQYWTGNGWVVAASGSSVGSSKTDTFGAVTATKVRLNITGATLPPSIWEFQIFCTLPTLSLASKVLIEKGLQIHSWITTDTTARPYPTLGQFDGIHMSGVTYYEEPLYNKSFHTANPGAQWNLAKAPYCTNAVGRNPPNGNDFLTADQRANIANAVSFCFGDEQGYSSAELGYLTNWFALSHRLYPNVLVHVNTYLGQWSNSQMATYIGTANPDLLCFDNYYFDQPGTIKDSAIPATIMDSINTIRPKALAGIDGSGNSPIAFGQYLLGYKTGSNQAGTGWYEITESQKYLVTNLTLAMGGKWLDMFRWEYNPADFLLFDAEGLPTRHYFEFAQSFREARNWGPHLVRLNSTDVRTQAGQHLSGSSLVTNALPNSVPAFVANAEFHLAAVSAANLGTQNNGLRGDVVVGYFKPLPGLDTSAFFPSSNPKYFMVVNGLTQGNGLQTVAQHGTLAETRQKVTLTFDLATGDPSKLRKVDRTTGATQSVALTLVSGSTYQLEDTLGGGQADLFLWAE